MVDETEKGWFVQYIDRDPETLRKMEAAKNREKHERDDEERLAAFIQVYRIILYVCRIKLYRIGLDGIFKHLMVIIICVCSPCTLS